MIANSSIRRPPLALAIAITLSLSAVGCGSVGVPAGSEPPPPAPVSPAPLTSGAAPAPAPTPVYTPPPPSPADQQLANAVADTTLRGTNPAGDDYCTYYAANGTLTTILRGSTPEAGSWTVSNGAVCERRGVGATVCSRFDFQPTAVVLTTVEGGRQTTATITRGNACTAF